MFNFQGVMDQFYNYTPDKDDDFGNAMKMTFAGNMVQQAFDKEMAKEMGHFQNALGQSNMQMAANLELANNSSMMQQEFNYGMQSMDAQFEKQNDFANAQFDRDIATIAATGKDARATQDNAGYNNRLQSITEAEQARLTDTNKITTESKTRIDEARVAGQETRETAKLQGDITAALDTNKSMLGRDEAKLANQLGQERDASQSSLRKDEAAQASGLRKDEAGYGSELRMKEASQASSLRKDEADFGNRLEARTRADQSKYARNTARAF